jgi:hypothetical protein
LSKEPNAPAPAPAEPVVLNKDTVVETNNEVRQPFAGTKVETNDQVQVAVVAEPDFEEVEIGNGTVIRTYTGVQPGAKLVDAAGNEIA